MNKMDKFDLLDLFYENANENENQYISGETIAAKFGITRAAVWKAVADLKKWGYNIESKTNNGYRLSKSFDILNEYEIKSKLKKRGLDFDVIYKQSTGSTNDDAKKPAVENSGKNMIIAAGELTAARGRYGRSFSAQEGGVYITLKICRPNDFFNVDSITFYPLIAAAATSRAVYDLCGIDLHIKWPNDLLHGDANAGYKKLCGILTEASFQAEHRDISYIIVGIGVNVNADGFEGELSNIASSLRIISGQVFDRADLICAIADNFMRLANSSREYLLEEYKKRLLTGIAISFAQNGNEYKGIAQSINENGNLLARINNGSGETLITVQSSEINFI